MTAKRHPNTTQYSGFTQIDGRHPLKTAAPAAYVEYHVRPRPNAQVRFFNFSLAKEMGLLSIDHPSQLNPILEQVIVDTFGLVIINEYDLEHSLVVDLNAVRDQRYMATRYLQLQHPSHQGTTSGDGRSIWNGTVTHQGKIWDVSSCGTGATCLSPATHRYGKFFRTGDPSISYGCGHSEVDEGMSALFFSEVLHANGIPTERILAILEYKNGLAINVRAYPNLLRPGHLFNHLKQGNWQTLKQVTDYYITRQKQNGHWPVPAKTKTKPRNIYQQLAEQFLENFARTVARFEDEYIFCWLDWDGDNILMDGAIIDYGSVRQFGLFHHSYRYDDVDRFSTNIYEQKAKAKLIVQTFFQAMDFIQRGKKRPLAFFRKGKWQQHFKKIFEQQKLENLLYKIGLTAPFIQYLLANHLTTVKKFQRTFLYFERASSSRGLFKVEDGINRNAIFCMRDILRELPQVYNCSPTLLNAEEFISIIRSSYATEKDLQISSYRRQKVKDFQRYYLQLIQAIARKFKFDSERILLDLSIRSAIINKYDRITGNSIILVVDKLLEFRPALSASEIFQILDDFVT